MPKFLVDNREIEAEQGTTLLKACLDHDIYIPNLCYLEVIDPPSVSCRMCFVEIEGRNGLVTACTEPVAEGMVVNTQNPEARRLARTAAELLLASHPVDCAHCAANGACELQTIARHLEIKLKTKRFRKILRDLPIDSSSSTFVYDPNKCVLCGKCIWVCRNRLGIGVLGFAQRGFQRMVTTFYNKPIAETHCQGCEDCVAVCPVGALVLKDTEKRVAAKQ